MHLVARMEFPQRFHSAARIAWPAWTAVSFNHAVFTQESHLCVNHRPVTQKLALKMWARVCFYISGRGTHQPAAICSFQGSQIADNRLGKQSNSGSQFSSTVNHLRRWTVLQRRHQQFKSEYADSNSCCTMPADGESSFICAAFRTVLTHVCILGARLSDTGRLLDLSLLSKCCPAIFMTRTYVGMCTTISIRGVRKWPI